MISVSVLFFFTKVIKMLKSDIGFSLFQVFGKKIRSQTYLYVYRFHQNVLAKIVLHSFNFYKTL